MSEPEVSTSAGELASGSVPPPREPGEGEAKRPSAGRARGWLRWAVPAVALVVGVGAGVGIMAAVTDPTSSQQYRDLAAKYSRAAGETSAAQAMVSQYSAAAESAAGASLRAAATLASQQAALAAQQAEVAASASSIAAAQQVIAQNSIGEGTWTVGVDVQPGTYRTTAPVGGDCYWSITKSGTNGANIIQNDIVTGGRPTVTLSPGQDFTTQRCGTWLKQ